MQQTENDKIREIILKFLYDKSVSAWGENLRRETSPPIEREVERSGYSRPQAVHNLSYLVDTGWVKKESESYTSSFGKTKTRGKTIYYRISDKGINHFEGKSNFQKSHMQTGINIVNVNGVTVVGDNNFVQTEQQDLYQILDLIKEEFSHLDNVDDTQKLAVKSDIETIQAQLAKPQPVKQIIQLAWGSLSFLANVDGLMNLYQKAEPYIQKLL